MLQSSLNNFVEEKRKKERKNKNITITIGFCKNFFQKPNKMLQNKNSIIVHLVKKLHILILIDDNAHLQIILSE
jgi:hypothetical protein